MLVQRLRLVVQFLFCVRDGLTKVSFVHQIIRAAFEDASGSDEELVEAIKYNEYALICFLLTIAVNAE